MFQTIFAAILGGLLIGIGVALIIDFLLKKVMQKENFSGIWTNLSIKL
jgi:hypothetical protein